ncbi:MAG: HAD family hydrolase [Promethearchaeota archaeon]
MYKLVVFDFDGTIADTMPVLEQNALELIPKYYNLSITEARTAYRSTTGLPFVQQIEILFPKQPCNEEVVTLFEEAKIKSIFKQPLFPDVKEILRYLKEKNYLVSISSSTIQPIIVEYFKRVNILDMIDTILGFRPGFEKGKHHFHYLMKKYKIQSKQLVFIGDSLKDKERAYMSDVPFIARIGPMFSESDFREVGHQGEIISALLDLKKII